VRQTANQKPARKRDISTSTQVVTRQELYGHFIASVAVWKNINGIVLEEKPDNAYEYKINIKMATYLAKKFLATPGASGKQCIDKEEELCIIKI